ncbi:MAG: hypothetical protein HQ501_07685 [Rhodospirillales bacterium]|nr:hypothetical protein [Rhodospirillales bacterium]
MIRKINIIFSLLAVVALVLASSGRSFAQDTSLTHDHASQVVSCMDMDSGDHQDKSTPAHESCTMHACPYYFPAGETVPTTMQVTRLDFSDTLKIWRPLDPMPFKRPPRTTI